MTFKKVPTCRICGHRAPLVWGGAAGPLFPEGCSVSGCEDRGWHRHCGQEDKHGGACTTAGCYPETRENYR